MISLRNTTKEYKLSEKITIAPVRGVNLEILSGEFVMVIGRSGTGKSTLLNMTAGLIQPTSGEVLIDNISLRNMSDKNISQLRSRKMGFIFQFPSLLPSLTVLENVGMPGSFVSCKDKHLIFKYANELLDSLGLSGKKDVYPRQLSAGEQKRAVIARSLINDPQIILADEPTSDLDAQTEKEVMEQLRGINTAGVTLFIVTHSLQLLSYADRAFIMEDGTLLPLTKANSH